MCGIKTFVTMKRRIDCGLNWQMNLNKKVGFIISFTVCILFFRLCTRLQHVFLPIYSTHSIKIIFKFVANG